VATQDNVGIEKNRYTSMPRVRFEPTIILLKRSKLFLTLVVAITAIGMIDVLLCIRVVPGCDSLLLRCLSLLKISVVFSSRPCPCYIGRIRFFHVHLLSFVWLPYYTVHAKNCCDSKKPACSLSRSDIFARTLNKTKLIHMFAS
jgi:hypothetical protein